MEPRRVNELLALRSWPNKTKIELNIIENLTFQLTNYTISLLFLHLSGIQNSNTLKSPHQQITKIYALNLTISLKKLELKKLKKKGQAREIITMRDWTSGTISTKSLKSTRSKLPLVPEAAAELASEDWVWRWAKDVLSSAESQELGSPKLELSCKSTKCWPSYIASSSLVFGL